jgi:LDH2 family malate/lactate/ureidoglycolate dehydrogenase
LTGAGIIDEVESWLLNLPDLTRMGHAFIAIDINAMSPILHFKERMNTLIQSIQQAPKAKGEKRIFLPGEIEWEKREKALKQGIILPEDVLANLLTLANDEGLDFRSIFE